MVKRIWVLTLIGLVMGWNLAGCNTLITPAPAEMPTTEEIMAVQEQYESQLMALQGVVGVGIGECEGQPCIKVFVEERTPELERQVPNQLEGFKVDIEVTGLIQPLPQDAPVAEPTALPTPTPSS